MPYSMISPTLVSKDRLKCYYSSTATMREVKLLIPSGIIGSS
jgi:hypothetical protein